MGHRYDLPGATTPITPRLIAQIIKAFSFLLTFRTTIVDGFARSHGLYVEPEFPRMAIMRDNLEAGLIYLKSRHVHTLINEIAESKVASSSPAAKAAEKIVGKTYLYTSPDASVPS